MGGYKKTHAAKLSFKLLDVKKCIGKLFLR
jgi:hypothetical protein